MKEKLQVLVVEDNCENAINIARVVKGIGHNIVGLSSTYDKAIEIASKTNVDLLISDIYLTYDHMDGIDIAQVLQQRYGTSVLFISNHRDEKTISKVAGVQSIGYLLKPHRKDDLEVLIKLEERKNGKKQRPIKKLANGYVFDMEKQELYHDQRLLNLSKRELLLVSYLARYHNELISYEQIDMLLWPTKAVGETTRRQFLYRLRDRAIMA